MYGGEINKPTFPSGNNMSPYISTNIMSKPSTLRDGKSLECFSNIFRPYGQLLSNVELRLVPIAPIVIRSR